MKKFLLMSVISALCAQAMAQVPIVSGRTDMAKMDDKIHIEVANKSSSTSMVSFSFKTPDDYENGITSDEQQLQVSADKNFIINVNTASSHFTYAGTATKGTDMPVNGVLGLMVTNEAGSSINAPFSKETFSYLSEKPQGLISGQVSGASQSFYIKYKSTPGFNYAGGNYKVNVIYTATEL